MPFMFGFLQLSVLALSSRFDGRPPLATTAVQVSGLSVLALSSRFDGLLLLPHTVYFSESFSTRSVESF